MREALLTIFFLILESFVEGFNLLEKYACVAYILHIEWVENLFVFEVALTMLLSL